MMPRCRLFPGYLQFAAVSLSMPFAKNAAHHWILLKKFPKEMRIPESNEQRAIDVSGLTEDQQNALQMRFGKDFSFKQIAEALNTSPVNARKLLSRAIKLLRTIYGRK